VGTRRSLRPGSVEDAQAIPTDLAAAAKQVRYLDAITQNK
jgi:hypothetical protein